MRVILTWFAASLILAVPAHAGDRPVLVELFTSQGCSSCPPADAFLHKLADRDDVIALALHVDYWDYIGWKDSFASPEHTKRQRAYAKADGRRMVYTPQMVIGGTDSVVGNRPMDVIDVIDEHRALPDTVALTVARVGDEIVIEAERLNEDAVPLQVIMMRFSPDNEVKITAGENAGRKLSYANVVTDMRVLGNWDDAEPLRMSVPAAGAAPVAVLLQRDAGAGLVEAASKLN